MENVFVSDLFHMEEMAGHQAKEKKSLVNGSTMEKGLGNAAKPARSTAQSSVTISQMTNISGLQMMTIGAAKCMNEQEANA